MLSYDPLPPADTIRGYDRPARRARQIDNQGFLQAFLNSLNPGFNVDVSDKSRFSLFQLLYTDPGFLI